MENERPSRPRPSRGGPSARRKTTPRRRPTRPAGQEPGARPRRKAGEQPAGQRRRTTTTSGKKRTASTGQTEGTGRARPKRRREPVTRRRRSTRPAPRRETPRLSPAEQAAKIAQRSRMLKLIGVGLVAILFVVGAVFVSKFVLAKVKEQAAPKDIYADLRTVACTPAMLDVTMQRTGDVAGQPIDFTFTIKNAGKQPCFVDLGNEKFRVEIESGKETIFDSQTCQVGTASKLLVLDTGLTTTQTIQWNGINAGAQCNGTAPATDGTYVARAYLEEKPLLERGEVFELGE